MTTARLLTQIAAGDAPQIMQIGDDAVPMFVEKGAFVPLLIDPDADAAHVTLIPIYIGFNSLGWINSFLPLIVPAFFGSPFYIFLMRQFFLILPRELEDAARVDGAHTLQILCM